MSAKALRIELNLNIREEQKYGCRWIGSSRDYYFTVKDSQGRIERYWTYVLLRHWYRCNFSNGSMSSELDEHQCVFFRHRRRSQKSLIEIEIQLQS